MAVAVDALVLNSPFLQLNVPERPYQIMAIRTPSRDSSTWTITHLDTAKRLDGYEIDWETERGGTTPAIAMRAA